MSVTLSDLPPLQVPRYSGNLFPGGNLPNIQPEIHLWQQTRAVLMVSCRQHLPISSRVWSLTRPSSITPFLFICWCSRSVFTHVITLAASERRRGGCFLWKVGSEVGWEKPCLAWANEWWPQTPAHYSGARITTRFLLSLNVCRAGRTSSVASIRIVTWRRRGDAAEAVTDGFFSPPSSNTGCLLFMRQPGSTWRSPHRSGGGAAFFIPKPQKDLAC